MTGSPNVALAAPLDVCVARKVRLVDLGLRIGGEGVCDEIAQARVDDKYGRVGSQKDVDIGSVGAERCLGPHNNGEDDGGLDGWSDRGTLRK